MLARLATCDNRRLGTRVSLDTMRLDWRFNYQLTTATRGLKDSNLPLGLGRPRAASHLSTTFGSYPQASPRMISPQDFSTQLLCAV